MNKQTEAMKLALEALEVCEQDGYIPVRSTRDAITALREALAEQPIIKSYLEKDNSLQPLVVPDALTAQDPETSEYRTGWNDCRQLMMEMIRKEIK